ncbi:MAG: acyltransferase family protein [Rhodospirillaceae bacterium]
MGLKLEVSPASGGRIAAIEELKGLAILLVIAFHCTCALWLPNFTYGHSGANLFLILSGLGLAWNLKDEAAGSFLMRRLKTVMPRYWAALALTLLLNIWILGKPAGALDIGLHALALHAFTTASIFSINISWWFIGVIVPLYGITVFLRPLLRSGRLDGLTAVGLALVTACLSVGTVIGTPEVTALTGHLISAIAGFFLGLAAGCILRNGSAGVTFFTPVLGVTLVLVALFIEMTGASLLNSPDTLYALIWTGFYLSIRRGDGWIPRRIRNGFAGIGSISFELYLYHLPVLTDYNAAFLRWSAHGAEPDKLTLGLGMVPGFVLLVGWCLFVRAVSRRAPRIFFLAYFSIDRRRAVAHPPSQNSHHY